VSDQPYTHYTPSPYHTSVRIGEEADAVRSQLAGACMTIKSLQAQLTAAQQEISRLHVELARVASIVAEPIDFLKLKGVDKDEFDSSVMFSVTFDQAREAGSAEHYTLNDGVQFKQNLI